MTCGAESVLAVQAAKNVVDFEWARAPLLEQLRILMQYGLSHRSWSLLGIGIVMVPSLLLVCRLGWRLLRVVEAPPDTQATHGAVLTVAA
jgi:hypothetical protein